MQSDDEDLEVEPAADSKPFAEGASTQEDINDLWSRSQLAENNRNFSIAELLVATGICAVAMTLLRFFPRGEAAAVAGLLVLIGLVAGSFGWLPRFGRLLVWVMLFLYLFMSAVTMVRG